MPRFKLKELFACMGLIAVGLAMVSVSKSPMFSDVGKWGAGMPLGLWYAGGMFIGVGAMAPFKKSLIGAWIGLFVFSLRDLRF
jgi:hypothetical protein